MFEFLMIAYTSPPSFSRPKIPKGKADPTYHVDRYLKDLVWCMELVITEILIDHHFFTSYSQVDIWYSWMSRARQPHNFAA